MSNKYDNYKDSGFEWIGEIPSHWEVSKVKFLLKPIEGIKIGPFGSSLKLDSLSDCGIKIYGQGNVIKDDFTLGERYIPVDRFEEDFKVYEIYDGDVLVTMMGTTGKSKVFSDKFEKGILDSHLIRLRFNKTKFNSYLFTIILEQSNYVFSQLKLNSKGSIMEGLNSSIVKDLSILVPPNNEQTVITNFLDHKTTQIDHLIFKKEQFIQLLEEERVAVINQAVTKGLNPSVPMKDSGIEWLGEIPENWELKRMKYLCDVTTGGKDTENREDDGEYPFFVRSQTIERISSYSFDGEAILTAGDGVGVCKVWHYVNEKFDFHQRVYMMCNFQPVLGKYLFYYLKENFGKEVMKLSAKSTVDSLRRPMFQNFMVCFGSLEEQKQIISHIEIEELRIETLISKSHQEIELLKEYKTALISEVVTGKVDVRDYSKN